MNLMKITPDNQFILLQKKIAELEEEIRLLRNIISSVPGSIYWKNKEGIYLGCNEFMVKTAGLNSQTDIIGKTDEQLWPEQADLLIENDKKVLEQEHSLRIEESVDLPDGKKRYFTVEKMLLKDSQENIIGIVGNSIEITELKQLQADLESANRAKTEFITNMSHDIRTPLSGVVGMSELLEEGLGKAEQKQYARWINDCGEQLLGLLNGILDVVSADHINENDIHEETFDLHSCLHDLLQLERPSTELKGLALDIDIAEQVPQYITSDRTKIHRILLNLLGNAIKFTERGGISIIVKLLSSTSKDVQLQFRVTDTGIGIPEKLQERVFDRFYRVNPSYKGLYQGHGIGLHIAQKYTALLGSEIKLMSEPGKGSAFYFDLSFKIGNAADVAANAQFPESIKKQANQPLLPSVTDGTEEASAVKPHSPHLLLVEDNQIALIPLQAIIRQAGCRHRSAMDGEEAFRIVTREDFDLIITDIGLPGMSGFELSQRIREWETINGRKPVPIVALTGHAKEEIEGQDAQSFINQVVVKPMRPDTLQAILDEFVLGDANSEESTEATPPIAPSELKLPELKAQLFEMNPFPLFELAKGLDAQAGNKEDLENQLKQLMVLIFGEEAEIQQAVAACNWPETGNLALKIKAKAVCCGTIRLAYACYYVEHYCQAGTYPSLLEKLCEQLIKVMQETKQCLEEWFKQGNRFSVPLPHGSCNSLGRDLPDREEQLFELEQYPLLDVAKGMEASSVSEEELAALLRIMMEEGIPDDKREIKQAYAVGDWEQVEKVAHRAKGGTDYAGTIRLKYACMYLERYRKAGHVTLLEPLYQQLIEVLDATKRHVDTWLKLKK